MCMIIRVSQRNTRFVGAGRIRELKPAGEVIRDVAAKAEAVLRELGGRLS